MAPLQARADHMPKRPTRAYANTAEPAKRTVKESWPPGSEHWSGYRARDWVQSGLVRYLAGVPIGQVWTGSPVSAQRR